MLLPIKIEAQLAQFFIQIKQNYMQMIFLSPDNISKYNQLKIDLNQLDIYDKDYDITINSLKDQFQQLGKDIKEEILQNFIIIIQGQQFQLQNCQIKFTLKTKKIKINLTSKRRREFQQGTIRE
ncbi:unnamed protein product [Paramecium primaurelia]|uniref:Uncharacterized protein n=1 Tax=Paramecium primaurelia TaxID=5886 RepID=A0A8S1LAH3_PARPR|nr:unnamed protein product [Paramecium primaurelia]